MSSSLTKLTHKQLFLTDFTIKEQKILITNPELINQVRKVLRLQRGDSIFVQGTTNSEQLTTNRYEVEIKDRTDKTLTGEILGMSEQIPRPSATPFLKGAQTKKGMIIAMPNRREKVELIVQKLTEIGLDAIFFWPSERSIIKQWNEKKSERLQKIAREAVEQSRGRTMPKIEFVTNIKDIVKEGKAIIFDKMDNGKWKTENEKQAPLTVHHSLLDIQTFGLVGPEGGLTERDYEALKGIDYEVRELGETMLRTETAAIVGGWIIRSSPKGLK